jgi:hypothetical protein
VITKEQKSDIALFATNILAILLLLIAMLKNPYDYYIFLRWALMIFFISKLIWVYKNKLWLLVWIVGLITYNPLVPIHSTRAFWTVINLVTILMIAWQSYQIYLILRSEAEK